MAPPPGEAPAGAPPSPAKAQKDADAAGAGKSTKKSKNDEVELSEEDVRLKDELDLLATRAQDADEGVQRAAVAALKTSIKTATSSMTSVPKPLKFLRPHYDALKRTLDALPAAHTNKDQLADVLSAMAMTMAAPGTNEALRFRLLGSNEQLGSWGHEYLRHLAKEIGEEHHRLADVRAAAETARAAGDAMDATDDAKTAAATATAELDAAATSASRLQALVDEIVPYNMTHNAEHEAVDLLMEVERLRAIEPMVDEKNHARVCNYLLQCALYVPEPEDLEIFKLCVDIYRRLRLHSDALRVALRLNDPELIRAVFDECGDVSQKKQLAFMLARVHYYWAEDDAELCDILRNAALSKNYAELGRDLEVSEAKTPEDIYKQHLTEGRNASGAQVESARQNLASSFVNAFVNVGFGHDKLITTDGQKWIHKNADHGMLSATASLGMVLKWDLDALTKVDVYTYSDKEQIKAGALLAIGLISSGVRDDDCDPAYGLLEGYVGADGNALAIRTQAVHALGLAYAGSAREDFLEMLLPIIEEPDVAADLLAHTVLALGMIFVGTREPQITAAVAQLFFERTDLSLETTPSLRMLGLGLGLLYMGKQELADVTLETLRVFDTPLGKYCALAVETCAYACTGNVLKVQKLLSVCSDRLEKDHEFQGVAVLGIAMVAMGEELGSDMAIRSFDHLLQYGEPLIRRSVPLALSLLCISNPVLTVADTLSKLTHDSDEDVSLTAIFGLGVIAAGTNNARIANLLRQLSSYYYKSPSHLFMVRIAQGLIHMGKGLLSISPFIADRQLFSNVGMCGILTVMHAMLDAKNTVCGKLHYFLFSLALAMFPRMVMTLDEQLQPLAVPVRIGQAVDVVGQAGKPKTITGFQTHTTPVLLSAGERAELATEDYLPLTSNLEGFVILKANPDAPPKKADKTDK